MSEYLDEVFDGLRSLSSVSIELADLSQAFEITGMDKLSKDIDQLQKTVQFTEERIRRAVAKEASRLAGSS